MTSVGIVAMMLAASIGVGAIGPHASTAGPHTLSWPVSGAVIRGYEPPSSPYGPGHRGIDIAAPFGTAVAAAAAGTVTFAGRVAGSLYVTLDHGGGLSTTYSWLSEVRVHKGDRVSRGAIVGLSGNGHPGQTPTHLHFGVKVHGSYVDPLMMLAPIDLAGLVHLAPLSASGGP